MLRGKALRQSLIIRVLAVERLLRAVLLGLAVWAVLAFRRSQDSIADATDRALPALSRVGIRIDQFALVQDFEKAVRSSPGKLVLIAVLLAGYAGIELVEAVGLWTARRWGEYFAVVATSVFLPLEIRELAKGITITRAGAFVINVAAVVYLLVSKRLFGIRGGKRAYEADRRGQQLLEVEQSAAGGSVA